MATPLLSYLIASPSSGSVSSLADTSSGTALNLTCTSVTGTSIASGVGATFGSSSGALSGSLSGKVGTALAGFTKATLEFVVDTSSAPNYAVIGGVQSNAFDEIFDVSTGGASGQISVNWSGGSVAFDCSTGLHRIMVVIDTTQATAANRILAYVDGSAATVNTSPTTPTYPSQNFALDTGLTNWANNRFNVGALTATGVQSFVGSIYFGMLYAAALTSTDASGHNTSLSSNNDADPNSSGLTLSLTGVSSTTAVGTLAPGASKGITGNASTAAVGTVAPARSIGITGTASTAAAGAMGVSLTLPLTGVVATGAVGSVSTGSGNLTLGLTGVAATAAVGSLGLSLSLALTGLSSTSAVGTVAPGASKGLTGVSSTAAVGTLAPALSLPLTGAAATGAAGNVTSSGGTPTAAVALSRWKLDETSGTTLADSIGSNTLTLNAGYTLNVTPPAVLTSSTGAIRGTTACIAARASASGLPNGNASQSWSLWIKATSNSGTQAIFSITNSTITAGAGLFISSGSLLLLEYNGSTTLVSATAPSTGSWHHVAWTYDASSTTNLLYVDGTQVGSATGAPSASTTADVILTSSDSGTTNPFAGDIDDVRVFSGVLTAAQVARMAAGGEPNDTTLSLTGVSSTAAVGSVGPARSLGLTGAAGTAAAGQLGMAVSLGLTGAAASGAAGTIGPGRSVGITGVASTSAVGSLTPALSIVLPGVAATGQVGTVGVNGNLTIALTGVSAAGAAGTVGPGRSVSVTGVALAGAVGTLGVAISRALTGVGATGIAGNLTIPIPLVPLYPPFIAVLGSVSLTAESTGDTLSVTGDT